MMDYMWMLLETVGVLVERYVVQCSSNRQWGTSIYNLN
jgi:hypothetical protein